MYILASKIDMTVYDSWSNSMVLLV